MRAGDLSRFEREALGKAMAWRFDTPDRETARWAEWFAASALEWAKQNKEQLRFRMAELVKELEPWLGLTTTMDTVERLTGARFN